MKRKLIYHYFTDDDFLRFSRAIEKAEKSTSGEIRLAIKGELPFFASRKKIRLLAEEEFKKLNMQNTRDRTGILIYLLLPRRMFYILADEGINSKVNQSTWDEIRDIMQSEFMNGKYSDGILKGIELVGKILSENFPIKTDDTNELSNQIIT
ncbi:TPM domain-containing protein [Melioribacter sp. OK-6-Me]|uniref:TPM domain-containing protein n=1 Tax=unclassified Melioribacter TaxID=2627329 RepID=UPI003EDA5EFB